MSVRAPVVGTGGQLQLTGDAGSTAYAESSTPNIGVAEPEVDDLALKWLALDAQARVIVDQDMRILWANADAVHGLDQRRDMEERDGMLLTVNRGLQRQLERFVGSCTSMLASWNLPRSDGDGTLIIRAQRLDKDDRGHCTYGLLFFGTGSDLEARYANLDTVFNLTASEHRVLLQMILGQDATGVAAQLKVSIDTVRSHIRSIYAKVGATSREGLFFKLRPYRL